MFYAAGSVEAARSRPQHWADLIAAGKADIFKEMALLPDFIIYAFGQLPGWHRLLNSAWHSQSPGSTSRHT